MNVVRTEFKRLRGKRDIYFVLKEGETLNVISHNIVFETNLYFQHNSI